MSIYIITILVVGTLVPMIFGVIKGNEDLFQKFNHGFNNFFLFWIVLKKSVINGLIFSAVVGALSMYLNDVWLTLAIIAYAIANFHIAKSKVINDYDIWLRPGEGVLTPEGRAKAEQGNQTKTSMKKHAVSDKSSTLIYSSFYAGSVIGRLENDGSVYDSIYGGSYIGRVEDCKVYKHSIGGSILARYNSDGRVYSGLISYDHLGNVSSDGIVYEPDLTDCGKPIAKVEGPNILGAGAAYLALLK